MRLRDRLLIAGAIALAAGLIVVAVAVGGESGDCPGKPAAIESLTPGCGAAALQLDVVAVDLAPGYEGELTIKDVTRTVDLVVEFEGATTSPYGQHVFGFSAHTEIDRDDWGLSWNVALESGGFMVSKKVKIEIEGEAVLQQG